MKTAAWLLRRQARGPALAVALVVLLALGSLWPASAQEPLPLAAAAEFKPGEVLVQFASGATAGTEDALRARYGATHLGDVYGQDLQIWQVAEGQELATIERLGKEPQVEHAQPNYIYHALGTPTDPYFGNQWAHSKMQSTLAWDISTGSSSLTIAVIDTGIDETHPDLAAKVVAGYDFVGNDANPHDLNGHGTHVAGIAAAVTNNGVGVAGMDWKAKIMPVRVLDASGGGYTSTVVAGINWAYDHGADVLNLSLGTTSDDWYLEYAVANAHAAGSLVVAAMGNCRSASDSCGPLPNPIAYPAYYDHVIAVAATGPSDTYAYYSQYGSHCDVAAPGGEMTYVHDPDGIYSTTPTYHVFMNDEGFSQNYDYLQGTSMATPYVAGLAALVWSVKPTLTADQVEAIIESTAVDLGPAGRDPNYGYGRIDALAALVEALDPPVAPVLSPIGNPDGDGTYLVDWNDVSLAASYTLQEDDNSSFSSPSGVYTGPTSELSVSGHAGGTWFYRVRASNQAGDSLWSGPQATVVRPAAPALAAISNPGNGDAYLVSWSAPQGAAGYRLQEADNSSFTSPATRYEGSALQLAISGQPAGTWYYRVLAFNTAGESGWSSARSTAVSARPLPAPTLGTMDNGDGDGSYTVDWSDVPGASSYTLEQSSDAFFSNPREVYAGAASQFEVAGQPGGKWYYRARASGVSGSGPWSNVEPVVVTSYLYLPMTLKSHDQNVLVDEGFEGGVIPPAGWELIPTDPAHTWERWPIAGYNPPVYPAAYEGTHAAACNGVGLEQDEVLLSPSFRSATALLKFYSFGDPACFWCDSLLDVWLVFGDWDGGATDDILVHTANGDWQEDPNGYYIWSLSSVDLTPYLVAGTPVRVAFQFTAGENGDITGLDAVRITRQ